MPDIPPADPEPYEPGTIGRALLGQLRDQTRAVLLLGVMIGAAGLVIGAGLLAIAIVLAR